MKAHPQTEVERAVNEEPSVALLELADHLREGRLALFLGAGCSRGVGLPLWYDLVSRCLRETGSTERMTSRTPSETLREKTREIERRAGSFGEFSRIVRKALYGKVSYSDAALFRPMLIALGALLTGSQRGSIRTVISFNFDDVIEWYLGVHGFRTQVVSRIPALLENADVTVFHPNGFLPLSLSPESGSDFLVFSQYSYDERQGDALDPWLALTRQTLRTRMVLFVGLSGKDPVLGPVLLDEAGLLREARPSGYWLLGPRDVDPQWFRERNIVPIQFTDYDEIPKFLLRICQRAGGVDLASGEGEVPPRPTRVSPR